MNLSPQEQQEYNKLIKIFSSSINEASENSIKKGVQYIAKNWRKYSKAMLLALIMNTSAANAINSYSPQLYNTIKTEVGINNSSNREKMVKFVDFSDNFQSGKSVITNKDKLQSNIAELQQLIKAGKKYRVKIIAGESKVTNPNGVEIGGLAKQRASNIETLLNKLGFSNIETETVIGSTPYVSGKDNPRDSKYTNEQFVKVEIYIDTQSICSLDKTIGLKGETGNEKFDYITAEEDLSGEGSLIFSTGTIPDRLVILGEDGKINKDTGYITTQKSTYNQWNLVPLYVAQLTEIKNEATVGTQIKKIKATNIDELVNQLLAQKYDWQKDTRKEIKDGIIKLQQLLDSGVTEFVIYNQVSNNVSVNFNEDAGDSGYRIYSPLGKTGFSLKGKCR